MNRRQIHGLLRGIRKVAIDSSLTGSMKGSARLLASTYNRCVDVLGKEDPEVAELFPRIDGESLDMDEIGAAATLLAEYVGDDD